MESKFKTTRYKQMVFLLLGFHLQRFFGEILILGSQLHHHSFQVIEHKAVLDNTTKVIQSVVRNYSI